MLFSLFRKKSTPRPEMVTLSEHEFRFLSDGVRNGGLVGAWSTDADAMSVALSLVSKGCLYRAGSLPNLEKTYIAWNMTSKGIDAALGHFTPEPGWFPFKKNAGERMWLPESKAG